MKYSDQSVWYRQPFHAHSKAQKKPWKLLLSCLSLNEENMMHLSHSEGSPDCWANHWYNPPHSPRTVFIQSEPKRLEKSLWTAHIQHTPLWTVTVWSTLQSTRTTRHRNNFFPQAIISWTRDIKRGTHNTIIFITHTHTFFFFKFAHIRPVHTIVYIIYCVFAILYIAYVYIILYYPCLVLLHRGASVTVTNSLCKHTWPIKLILSPSHYTRLCESLPVFLYGGEYVTRSLYTDRLLHPPSRPTVQMRQSFMFLVLVAGRLRGWEHWDDLKGTVHPEMTIVL